MKALSLIIAAAMMISSLSAKADETPVFVSCYSDAGEHLQLIFDTAGTTFSYRYAKLTGAVDEYEAYPSGHFGAAASRVMKAIPADQSHIELQAHIVGGNAEMPVIDTHIQVTLDRDATGSLRLSTSEFFHLSQPVDLSMFKAGSCYVQ